MTPQVSRMLSLFISVQGEVNLTLVMLSSVSHCHCPPSIQRGVGRASQVSDLHLISPSRQGCEDKTNTRSHVLPHTATFLPASRARLRFTLSAWDTVTAAPEPSQETGANNYFRASGKPFVLKGASAITSLLGGTWPLPAPPATQGTSSYMDGREEGPLVVFIRPC